MLSHIEPKVQFIEDLKNMFKTYLDLFN